MNTTEKPDSQPQLPSRRTFFDRVSDGLLGAAATLLTGGHAASAAHVWDNKPRSSHHPPKARSVIQLFMNGGPSHIDLFDPKPVLHQRHGERYFPHQLAAQLTGPEEAGTLMRSPFRFQQHGQAGLWLSEVMPCLAQQADSLAVIRSMVTNHPNHEPALFMAHSGRTIAGRPGLGAWVVYGLGSENQNLPAYVVLDDPRGLPNNGTQGWQSGFLPPLYQGTRLRSEGPPIVNLQPEQEYPSPIATAAGDLLSHLDQIHRRDRPGYGQLDARISSYELAARMQMDASDALDVSQENAATLDLYGVGDEPTDSYGRRCLMARRLVERGVRMVQIYMNQSVWDHHSNLEKGLRDCCHRTDKPIAALLRDLRERGLFSNTLVVWGGEFGRIPVSQQSGDSAAGRDHNPRGFSLWMAGAGIRAGTVYGSTDEIGFEAAENPVTISDWHATILHLLGLDFHRLTYNVSGLPERLTANYPARVVDGILA